MSKEAVLQQLLTEIQYGRDKADGIWSDIMKEVGFKILKNHKIADRTYEMALSSMGEEHGIDRAGRFVNIRLDGLFLRRPISVCDWNKDAITIIYKTVGKGTEAMSQMRTGQHLDILTPLGNGFDICKSEEAGARPLLIGGGAGVPPMYGLCRLLTEKEKKPVVILGFNSEKEIFYIENFRQLGADVMVTTADGSLGLRGFVTDAMKAVEYTYIFACGPEAMLKAIDNTAAPAVGGQMSFEERMGCGFGACMGCSCETKYGSKRICREGPVLERGEIIW